MADNIGKIAGDTNEGDRRAWRAFLEGMGESDAWLTNDEVARIVTIAAYTAEFVDGLPGVHEDNVAAILEWAKGVRLRDAMLDTLLDGSMYVRWKAGADEPSFQLSKQGELNARSICEKLGLPVQPPEESADA